MCHSGPQDLSLLSPAHSSPSQTQPRQGLEAIGSHWKKLRHRVGDGPRILNEVFRSEKYLRPSEGSSMTETI